MNQVNKHKKFKVNSPHADDADCRLQFCDLILDQYKHDEGLFGKIVWSYEATFKLNEQVNMHNCKYWFTENYKNLLF